MQWSLHDLAPVCLMPTCLKYQTRHLLPHQEEIAIQILTGNENYIYWQGGVGSAKTLLWGVLSAAYSIMIPNTQNILFRKFYADNYKTLWKYFKASIKAATEQGIIQANYEKLWSVKKQGDYTVCELPNGSLIFCGETKSWTTFMGPSYDLIVVSDAMENNNFGEIFRGKGVVGGLQSRLRGQASSFYKLPSSTKENPQYKDMRRFLIESNPPPNINDLHTLFGKEPGVRYFPAPANDISYRFIESSSIQNDHNPPSYVREIASQHTDAGERKRILEGKSVVYYGGIKVITSFNNEVHVNKFTVDEDLPLFVSIDPGVQHPSVIFFQIKRCSYEKEHVIRLSEITNLYDKTTKELVTLEDADFLGILPHLALYYPTFFDYELYSQVRRSLLKDKEDEDSKVINFEILTQHFSKIHFCIDGRGGIRKYSTNKDRETDKSILLTHYGIRAKHKSNIGKEKSLERMIEHFKELCICNIPVGMIDINCSLLIDAYSGGYRYKELKDGSHSEKPIEDHVYEDPADADRYGLENFYFTPYIPQGEEEAKPFMSEGYPWSWLNGR